MNYKSCITALTFSFIFISQKIQAQDYYKFNPNQTYTIGVANPWWYSGTYLISIRPDHNTKRIYPLNYINYSTSLKEANANFVYIEGAHSFQVYTILPPSAFKNYRYRIIANDTFETAHWQEPSSDAPTLSSHYISSPSNNQLIKVDTEFLFTRLASLICKGKKITIQIYNIHKPNDIHTIYIYNKPIPRPEITEIISIKQSGWEKGMTRQSTGFIIGFRKGDRHRSIGIDSIYQLKVSIKKSDASMIYNVYVENLSIKDSVPSRIPVHWETETTLASNENGHYATYPSQSSRQDTMNYAIIPKYVFNKPGKYKITVVPQLSGYGLEKLFKDKAATATFTVLPPSQESYTLQQLAPYIGISALILGIGFWQYKTYQKKKLSKETRQKEMTKTQLSSIRSQLNPHFMYNALAGIQNLMNKNETEKANHYLGRFSRLTRNVLEGSVNDLISIANEETLLDDYLQMEQLRFGFQYAIDIDENINRENTEIPAMLLQPFAENAVKHGIAELKSNGRIHIHFSKNDENLVIRIKDNGAGFDTGKKQDGFGLKLSQKRIALLNEVYKESRITLKMQSDENGTDVSINLHNWI